MTKWTFCGDIVDLFHSYNERPAEDSSRACVCIFFSPHTVNFRFENRSSWKRRHVTPMKFGRYLFRERAHSRNLPLRVPSQTCNAGRCAPAAGGRSRTSSCCRWRTASGMRRVRAARLAGTRCGTRASCGSSDSTASGTTQSEWLPYMNEMICKGFFFGVELELNNGISFYFNGQWLDKMFGVGNTNSHSFLLCITTVVIYYF